MEKILITGASGLIGKAVLEKLNKDKYEVWAVISGRREIVFPKGVNVVKGNLLDYSFLSDILKRIAPSICLHYAWALNDGFFQKSEENLAWIEASIKLIRLFKANGGKYFFFAGSSAEYGRGTEGFEEYNNEKGEDLSLYGCTKLCFEKIAFHYCKQESINFLSGRYFSVYGPRDVRKDSALPTIINNFLERKKFVCKSPENLWDYIYIDDCAEATIKLLEKNCVGIYNIASGRPKTMRYIFLTIAHEMNAEELLEFEDNKTPKTLTANINKLKKDTGFECNTSFEEGIKETIQWWRDKYNE